MKKEQIECDKDLLIERVKNCDASLVITTKGGTGAIQVLSAGEASTNILSMTIAENKEIIHSLINLGESLKALKSQLKKQ